MAADTSGMVFRVSVVRHRNADLTDRGYDNAQKHFKGATVEAVAAKVRAWVAKENATPRAVAFPHVGRVTFTACDPAEFAATGRMTGSSDEVRAELARCRALADELKALLQ